jgi:uncharacterized hydrophobic protein (TIGR00271 family)
MQRNSLTFHLWRTFALRRDQAAPETIDANIRAGTQISGTNMWILMFAIMIASVGLNVNSTATIIGAMLISPLMGPIIAAGYGAGIGDFALIRKALRSLAIFATISLLTSTLYFLLTPLHDAQSELLARTSPNLWDVLIAFFGGAAGMIGLSRKEKTTVIAGVGIATALMPPLCTVGFGIATGQLNIVLGAFYLFAINGVFIALATLAVTRILHLPQYHFPDEATRKRGRLIIVAIVTVTLVPSIYLAIKMVQEQMFARSVHRYVDAVTTADNELIVASSNVDFSNRRISLWLVGGAVSADYKARLEAQLRDYKLEGAQLEIHLTSAGQRIDVAGMQQQLSADIRRSSAQQLEEHRSRISVLEQRLHDVNRLDADVTRLPDEIRAQYPAVKKVTVSQEVGGGDMAKRARPRLVVVLDVSRALAAADRQRLERWLAVRIPDHAIDLVMNRG